MKILKLSWASFGDKEIEKAFRRAGIECVSVSGLNTVIKHHTYDHRVAEMVTFI